MASDANMFELDDLITACDTAMDEGEDGAAWLLSDATSAAVVEELAAAEAQAYALPRASGDFASVCAQSGHGSLLSLLRQTGLADELPGLSPGGGATQPLTVFAPSDKAFAALHQFMATCRHELRFWYFVVD